MEPQPVYAGMDDVIASPQQIINVCRAGGMFILVDSDDPDSEGDLVISAQFADPDAVNFMARFGRGLISLALTGERVSELELALMAPHSSANTSAFTVSIEAREGVSTGISAADRARTIAVAIDPVTTKADLVTPGHIFPLRARDGGVLMRAGHTEAAVDYARLAGLVPAGVICQIMSKDGALATLPDISSFASEHGLLIGTIADLIAYRRQRECTVEQVAEYPFHSLFGGKWSARVFKAAPDGTEHLALVKGKIDPLVPTLVRMHTLSLFADLLGDVDGGSQQLQAAMAQIGEAGSGAVVILRDAIFREPTSIMARVKRSTDLKAGRVVRDYGIGAQIVRALGVRRVRLLTNSATHVLAGFEGFELSVVEERPIALGPLSPVKP